MDGEILDSGEPQQTAAVFPIYTTPHTRQQNRPEPLRGRYQLTPVELVAISLHSSLGRVAVELKVLCLFNVDHVASRRAWNDNEISMDYPRNHGRHRHRPDSPRPIEDAIELEGPALTAAEAHPRRHGIIARRHVDLSPTSVPVTYTQLRAHETKQELERRLLLE